MELDFYTLMTSADASTLQAGLYVSEPINPNVIGLWDEPTFRGYRRTPLTYQTTETSADPAIVIFKADATFTNESWESYQPILGMFILAGVDGETHVCNIPFDSLSQQRIAASQTITYKISLTVMKT